MSFVAPRHLLRSTSVRLTAWYFIVFVASVAVVGAVDSAVIAHSEAKREERLLSARVEEYRTEIETEGVTGLARAVSRHGEPAAREAVRLREGASTLYEHMPPARDASLDSDLPPSRWRVVATEVSGHLELQVGRSTDDERALLQQVRDASLAALAATLILGLLGGAFVTRRMLGPLRALTSTTRTILASGNLGERVTERGANDELDELSSLFNQMLQKNETLVRGMREALDNVAHDLRTPLTRFRTGAELALRSQDASSEGGSAKTNAATSGLRDALADAVEESDGILVMLRTLMDISAAETGAMRLDVSRVALDRLVREVAETYELVAEERGVRIVTKLAPASVRGDAGRLRQLLANLVDNAIKYSPSQENLVVEIETRAADGFVDVEVRDHGPGIPRDEQPRIFDRLYRGDSSRAEPGLGLGLSFVKAIADAHGGEIRVESAAGSGTRMIVRLPAAAVEA